MINKSNNMKCFIITISFLALALNVTSQIAQKNLEGTVSYVSSQHIYVKFASTENIQIGDTLFLTEGNRLIPALKVDQLSTISCVGSIIGNRTLVVSTRLVFVPHTEVKQSAMEIVDPKILTPVSVNDQAIKNSAKKESGKWRSKFDGRVSLSSYSNISDYNTDQRFRYNVSMNAQHINNSRFTGESYISFSHKNGQWNEISKNVFSALKIYTLAVKYDVDSTSNIWFGRRINVNMANVGAVDGLQYEKKIRKFTLGAVVGSRPNYSDYSFNPDLMQYGAFIGHNFENKNGSMQTSVAFFNQMNRFNTDRRFAYLQHNNSLAKNLNLFCSFEIDLYTMKNLKPVNTFDLTSTYVSLGYRPWRKLSLSLSYDARKNIYYYETFKNTIDSILDKEMRQGMRFQFNYRPIKYVSWGGNAGYRFQKSDPKPSINASSYINYSQLPLIHVSTTINATKLKTAYLDGMMYGLQFSRDLIPGKLSAELEGRYVDYQFLNSPSTLQQKIGEFSLYWQIANKISLSADFEETIEKGTNYSRIFLNLTKRF